MIKTLTKHGNSYALVIDKAIMDILKITPETPLEITTDGTALRVAPLDAPQRRTRVSKALDKVNRRFGRALKRLAE